MHGRAGRAGFVHRPSGSPDPPFHGRQWRRRGHTIRPSGQGVQCRHEGVRPTAEELADHALGAVDVPQQPEGVEFAKAHLRAMVADQLRMFGEVARKLGPRYLGKPFTAADMLREFSETLKMALDWMYKWNQPIDPDGIARHVHDTYQKYRNLFDDLEGPLPPSEESLTTRPAVRHLERLTRRLCALAAEQRQKSARVHLGGRNEPPTIDGRQKRVLTPAAYDVISALLRAKSVGCPRLPEPELVSQGKDTDARKILTALADSDSDWKAVILFPNGLKGAGYGIA